MHTFSRSIGSSNISVKTLTPENVIYNAGYSLISRKSYVNSRTADCGGDVNSISVSTAVWSVSLSKCVSLLLYLPRTHSKPVSIRAVAASTRAVQAKAVTCQ